MTAEKLKKRPKQARMSNRNLKNTVFSVSTISGKKRLTFLFYWRKTLQTRMQTCSPLGWRAGPNAPTGVLFHGSIITSISLHINLCFQSRPAPQTGEPRISRTFQRTPKTRSAHLQGHDEAHGPEIVQTHETISRSLSVTLWKACF